MVLDTSVVWFLDQLQCLLENHATEKYYLTILQAQVCYTSHWRCFALGKILVHLINTFRDVIVCLVEEITTANRQSDILCDQPARNCISPAALHIVEMVAGSLRIFPGLVRLQLRLHEFRLDIVKPKQHMRSLQASDKRLVCTFPLPSNWERGALSQS